MSKCAVLKQCFHEYKKMVYALDGQRTFVIKEMLFQSLLLFCNFFYIGKTSNI